MDSRISYYDIVRVEFFQFLLPRLLGTGSEEEKLEFFNALLTDGENVVEDLLSEMCEQDNHEYPYKKKDFKFMTLVRGGVNLLRIDLPPYNPDCNSVVRSYVLFMKHDGEVSQVKYFTIMNFAAEKSSFILHIDEAGESLLGEELTGHLDDEEYEYWKLVVDYSKVLLKDIEREEIKEKNAEREWSVDWANFDWSVVRRKFAEGLASGKTDYDIGISEEEFLEFLDWLMINNKEEFYRSLLYLSLRENGFDPEQTGRLMSNPDYLKEVIKMWQAKN